jgi:hypothetical protein
MASCPTPETGLLDMNKLVSRCMLWQCVRLVLALCLLGSLVACNFTGTLQDEQIETSHQYSYEDWRAESEILQEILRNTVGERDASSFTVIYMTNLRYGYYGDFIEDAKTVDDLAFLCIVADSDNRTKALVRFPALYHEGWTGNREVTYEDWTELYNHIRSVNIDKLYDTYEMTGYSVYLESEEYLAFCSDAGLFSREYSGEYDENLKDSSWRTICAQRGESLVRARFFVEGQPNAFAQAQDSVDMQKNKLDALNFFLHQNKP